MTRIQYWGALGTSISKDPSKGISSHPSLRAAAAGNSALRSLVVVKNTAAMLSKETSFSDVSFSSNSVVALIIADLECSLAVVAPRIPHTLEVFSGCFLIVFISFLRF